ncbi:MAG: hypothetical protein ACI379_10690 [Nocardioides sp.]|uniref:hypothetical protein n=1 Tax=Nocardioides sp. TaxID=35761 RepID=UPI003F085F6B
MTKTPVLILALALSMAACGTTPAPTEPDVINAQLSDRFPNSTATDWVTYGDAVAVVEVTESRRGEPSEDALEIGEGDVPRTVEFTIKDIVWERPEARRLPESLDYPALGWHFKNGAVEDAKALVSDDRPLFHEGHQYLVTLAWQDRRCYEGDGVIPGHWVGLGSGSSIPITDKILGVGEFGGQEQDLEAAQTMAKELPQDSVFAQVVGGSVDDVQHLLNDASPTKREDFGPSPSDC